MMLAPNSTIGIISTIGTIGSSGLSAATPASSRTKDVLLEVARQKRRTTPSKNINATYAEAKRFHHDSGKWKGSAPIYDGTGTTRLGTLKISEASNAQLKLRRGGG